VAVASAQRLSEQQEQPPNRPHSEAPGFSSRHLPCTAHAFAVADFVANDPQEPLKVATKTAAEALLALSAEVPPTDAGASDDDNAGAADAVTGAAETTTPAARRIQAVVAAAAVEEGFDFLFDCQTFHCLYNIRGRRVGVAHPRHLSANSEHGQQPKSKKEKLVGGGGDGVVPRMAAERYASLLKPGGHLLLMTGHAESDGGAERGPVRLTQVQVKRGEERRERWNILCERAMRLVL